MSIGKILQLSLKGFCLKFDFAAFANRIIFSLYFHCFVSKFNGNSSSVSP